VSGAGKSTIIAHDFLLGKLRGDNIAVIPDIVHFTRVETPKSNLYDGGGFEEFAYWYLFLDRYTHVTHCMHLMTDTEEHKVIYIDETPLTEYCVAKVRGARKKYLDIMEKMLILMFERIGQIVYVKPTWKNYKHRGTKPALSRKAEMFNAADKELVSFLKRNKMSYETMSIEDLSIRPE